MDLTPQQRLATTLMTVGALLIAVIGFVVGFHGSGSSPGEREAAEHEGGRDNLSHAMKEALERNPGLAKNRMALAFVSEKLEESGGEASGEIVNGPSQESYDQRAFPRTAIGAAQQKKAKESYGRAKKRGGTAAGQQAARQAAGSAVAAAAAWTPLGPNGGKVAAEATYTGTPEYVSGRTTALAVDPACTATTCTLYAGTAGGGLWKTSNPYAADPTWTSIGSGIPSQAIGTVSIAPNGTMYVGTGEPNGSSDSEAGLGLYKSTDGGSTFSHVAAADPITVDRSIAAVAVDPADPQHVLVGTAVARHGSSSVNGGRFTPPGAPKVGLYESTDGGASWTLALSQDSDQVDPSSPSGNDYFRGGISKIVFDPTHAHTVYASMFDYGLFRASAAKTAGGWQSIYSIKTPGSTATGLDSRVEFSLAKLSGGRTRIYLGDATYYDNAVAGFLRTDDGTAANPSWKELSDPTPGTPGYGTYNFCQGQCSYDMVVTSPEGQPDEVVLSGSMNYDELLAFGGPGNSNGRAVVRSTDAGVSVRDMTNDAAASPHGLHPDHHAFVFVPGTAGTSREQFFSGSDGGIVRGSGPFVDRSADCAKRGLSGAQLTNCQQWLSAIPTENQSLNKGLQTLQFQSVSVAGSTVQGGTQDNGTWESDQDGFSETIGGDGGQSGFNAADSKIRFHSYYGPAHDVSFDGGTPRGWDYISDPLDASGEAASFYVPLTVDPTVAGTVFDGLQHVWRTTDNGGDRAFLDKYCNEITGDYGNRPRPCGDWKPLGAGAGDLSRNDANNYIVAVEKAPQRGSQTLWAATRKGDLWVSANANDPNPSSVKFRRYDDKLALPNRFVSSITIDPADANHAFVSFSGYSAYSPGGHVFEVRVDPQTGKATSKDLSGDLGDMPITDLVYKASNKTLYAATDFGVVTSPVGSGTWVAFGKDSLPSTAVYGLTLSKDQSRLYAATHGRSVWSTPVG